VVVLALAAACAGEQPSVRERVLDRPQVVVGSFPWAEAVRMVAGDAVSIVNLTPVGGDPHDLRLTRRQAEELDRAELVVVTGRGYQPEVERAVARRAGPTLVALDVLGIEGDDPHVWLDPLLMREMVRAVAAGLRDVGVDADEAEAVAALEDLHARFAATLEPCRRRELVVAHEAFGYLAARYRLQQIPLGGHAPAPDEPPDADRLAEARAAVRAGATPFVETLVPSPALDVLAAEEQVSTAVLNPAEGLIPSEQADAATYRSILLYDLEVLADHLDC
jgi:zinc transport system substrate-binding protein